MSLGPLSILLELFILILLVWLPLYVWATNHIVPPEFAAVASASKEFFTILALVSILGIVAVGSIRTEIRAVHFFLIGLALLASVQLIFADDKLRALAAYRSYALPTFLLVALSSIRLGFYSAKRLLMFSFIFASALATWVIVTEFVSDLAFLAFAPPPGAPAAAFEALPGFNLHRLFGPFVSSNEFGLYLSLHFLVGMWLRRHHIAGRWWSLAGLGALGLGVLLTFSRSAWLALVLGATILATAKRLPGQRHLGAPLMGLILTISLLAVLNPLAVSLATERIASTVAVNDPSTVGHISSLQESWRTLSEHPFGIGLGESGPRVAAKEEGRLNPESSFVLLAFELGWAGPVLFFGTLIAATKQRKTPFQRWPIPSPAWGRLAISLAVATMGAFLFLPTVAQFEATALLGILVGLSHDPDEPNGPGEP